MLSFASDFRPLFWTIIGAGVLLTGALSALVATASFRRPVPVMISGHSRRKP